MIQSATYQGTVQRWQPAVTTFAPGLSEADARPRAALASAGFVPVTLIAISTFDIFGLRDLATHILVPVVLAVGLLVCRQRHQQTLIGRALLAGMAATALYDLFRFSFLWLGLMDTDPIPHIGSALGLEPAWVFGYLWRYLGNGGGLAIAFAALGIRGVRHGVVYGLFVCGGLLATLVVSPHAQEVLFPLTPITIVMATIGHMIYGAVLGTLSRRVERPSETVIVLPARQSATAQALTA